MQISSVSNPRGHLESAELEPAAAPRLPGAVGSAADASTLAEKHLVVRGRRPSAALESILGPTDDRTRILETAHSPWRRICALEIIGSNGAGFVGTGWLAGPRTVVTAGHCVNHPDMGGWARTIKVSAGRNGREFPFETLASAQFSSVDRWTQQQDPDFDYGAIHLPTALGETVGWFTVMAASDADLARRQVNISGYPGSPGFGTEQWFHSNGVLRTTARRVFYDVDTTGGQSGAPVWIQSESDEPVVVAIHAYGVGGTPVGVQPANSAPRIIPEVLSLIEGWVANGPNGS